MKKELLYCLLPLSMMAGQAMAQSQLCQPELSWGSYAVISKVEINGMVNESTIPDEWTREYIFEDFTMDNSKVVSLTPGEEYDLTITVCNFDSGAGDEYYVTAYFDWDGDNELTAEETVFQKSIMVGVPGPTSFKIVTDKVKVPTDAMDCTMRVYLHYKTPDVPYTDPCCKQDSGQFEDYKFTTGNPNSIANVSSESFSVYPNPTEGTLYVNAEEAGEYMLYSVDGKMVQKGMVMGGAINVAANQPGMYILKVQTGNGVKQTTVVIK